MGSEMCIRDSPSPPTALPPSPPPFPPPAPFATTTLFVDVTNIDYANADARWDWIWHIESSLAEALPQSYKERFHNDRDSSSWWTRATFSLKARMTIPGVATIDGVSDAAFTRAVAADLGVDVDTVVIVNKTVSFRRRRARALLTSGGVTVNYELSNYATVANTREDPNNYWGSINSNMTRELYVRNRVLESEAFSNVEAAFGATPDVSDPPAYPMSATCELFMMAGSVEEAAAVLATAEDPGFPAEVNTWIRRWYPTQTAWVTKVSATPEVHHPPPEDSMADGMIALYSCIAIVAGGLAAGAAYRWGGALRRKLAPSGAVSDTAKVAPRPSKAPKSSTAKVAPAPPKAPK